MAVRNSDVRYGAVAMVFHWVIAALLLCNIALGAYMADLPRGDPGKFLLFQTHKSIGLTVLILSAVRIVWRLINPVPPLPPGMGRGLTFGARVSHTLLYVFILAVPLAGWAMVSASPLGTPTLYFGLFEWPHMAVFADLPRTTKIAYKETFQDTHAILAYSALALIAVHALAALYHQFMLRDDVLKRMLPGTRVGTSQ